MAIGANHASDRAAAAPGIVERLRRPQAEFDALARHAPQPTAFDWQGRHLLARVRTELGAGWRVVSSWYDDDAAFAAELDDPRRLTLAQEFEHLPAITRQEVAHFARMGEHHADARAAAAARAWAKRRS